MNADIAISAQNLKKSYGDVDAVQDVTFEVHCGEIFGLLGPNGAGKTTTISMLTGLIIPSSGQLSIHGMKFIGKINKLKSIIGVVPQALALYPTITARDNLNFFGAMYGLSFVKLKKRVEYALEVVGLSAHADAVVDTYSGGMKRRLNLAVALLNEPKVLFLDEPTVGVDPQSRNAIFDTIKELNADKGLTVIYTTHYMEEAERLCNQVAIMDKGKIIALDTPANLCKMVNGGLFRVQVEGGDLDALVQSCRKVEIFNEIVQNASFLEVSSAFLQDALIQFINIAKQYKVKIVSLNFFEANLEAVFLKLTGKELRDQ